MLSNVVIGTIDVANVTLFRCSTTSAVINCDFKGVGNKVLSNFAEPLME
jgi:hypothetical protein